ncbi:MAG: hypothetical protein FD143_3061 [Ignavibacteria bacterium]|nr:MAG: hypothetical protein FD143_3061 [Ignavibacteria bacterium]KAF0154717.1 MAG: hypothetical protein FD188_3235 [Ignavibacteria bacterium]
MNKVKNNRFELKDWTEPNGIFIMNIPIDWQYKNVIVQDFKDESPYSFEKYDNSIGCFQISCYPLSERGVNNNQPVQKNNSRISWLPHRMDGEGFNVRVFYAQVDDQFCMAKYIYSTKDQDNVAVKDELEKVEVVLDTFRLIPLKDRTLASNLKKYDNFLGSLIASFDLWQKALNNDSFIELVVITSNQIDAFLRLSIILHKQLEFATDDIEIEYLFQSDDEKGFMERKIYSDAYKLGIINDALNNELNDLYNQRNRVIHRYIISNIKTKDIFKIAYDYGVIAEKVRMILKSYEENQYGKEFGIYGRGFKSNYSITEEDRKRAFAMLNDKHLLKNLKRKL